MDPTKERTTSSALLVDGIPIRTDSIHTKFEESDNDPEAGSTGPEIGDRVEDDEIDFAPRRKRRFVIRQLPLNILEPIAEHNIFFAEVNHHQAMSCAAHACSVPLCTVHSKFRSAIK